MSTGVYGQEFLKKHDRIQDRPHFVTAISDCISPQASFYDGKLFLVGDALALFRPHVAQSTNQSVLHCLLLEKLLQGGINFEA
jgi:2-polyprenyl-6-methoxyphenol hydroxylase-like FAD-dependent oxidoreductase